MSNARHGVNPGRHRPTRPTRRRVSGVALTLMLILQTGCSLAVDADMQSLHFAVHMATAPR